MGFSDTLCPHTSDLLKSVIQSQSRVFRQSNDGLGVTVLLYCLLGLSISQAFNICDAKNSISPCSLCGNTWPQGQNPWQRQNSRDIFEDCTQHTMLSSLSLSLSSLTLSLSLQMRANNDSNVRPRCEIKSSSVCWHGVITPAASTPSLR